MWGEVEEFICNTCRFDKKASSDWVIEGPTKVSRHSVISANKYRADLIEKPGFALKVAETQYKDINDDRPYLKEMGDIKSSEDYKGLMQKNKDYFRK
jgi:NADH-quinone oxidoreductase subunit G